MKLIIIIALVLTVYLLIAQFLANHVATLNCVNWC